MQQLIGGHMILVLVTNSHACKMYNYTKQPANLSLIDVLNHPESMSKTHDLVSDKAGGFNNGTHVPHTDPKEVELEKFTKEIAEKLVQERHNNNLDKVIVIAPPQVDGRLMQNLDKHVKQLITFNIKKDLVDYSDDQLLKFLHEHTRYAN